MFLRLILANSLFLCETSTWHLDSCPSEDTWYGVILWVLRVLGQGLKAECADLFHQSFLWLLRHTDEPQKGRNSCLWLQSRSVLSSFGVVLTSCRVNFHVVQSALHCRFSLFSFWSRRCVWTWTELWLSKSYFCRTESYIIEGDSCPRSYFLWLMLLSIYGSCFQLFIGPFDPTVVSQETSVSVDKCRLFSQATISASALQF